MAYLRVLRIWQWTKNLIIFVPVVLSKSLSFEIFYETLILFFLFSLFVSGTYIFNDIKDINLDSQHPEKSKRPIASKAISLSNAKRLGVALLTFSLIIVFLFFDYIIFFLFIGYLILTLLYTSFFKYINLLDSITISSLFIIRIFLGRQLNDTLITSDLLQFTFFMCIFIVYLKKNSIVNKNISKENKFFNKLVIQNRKLSFNFYLYFFGLLSNIFLILWGYQLYESFHDIKFFFLLVFFVIFAIFTFQLIKFSNNGKLEDFIFAIVKEKMLLYLTSSILFLFIYIYF